MSKEKLADARQFFRDFPVYDRLFKLFKEKYQSIGKIGGNVQITNFSKSDLDEIAAFFETSRKELLERGKGKLSLLAFEQQLERTKFEGIRLLDLLECYFNRKIISKNELKREKELFFEVVFCRFINQFPDIYFWLAYLQKKSADTHWIYRLLERNESVFNEYVDFLNEAFLHLPEDVERIAMFSQRITNNPHAFDQNTDLGKLWLHLLSVYGQEQEGGEIRIPSDSEAISQLLEKFMLYRDDITNFVTVVNILVETSKGLDPVWGAAAAKDLPFVLNAPIRELTSLTKAYPVNGRHEKKVWVVENSGVYSTILDRNPKVPLICTHGQFKLASLKLMDLLVKDGCQLMYAGDFDPEGLSMLQRLMLRYKKAVVPWRMDVSDYEASKPSVVLSKERLAKLGSICLPELEAVKQAILNRKKAGYQEAIVAFYFKDLG